MAGIRELQIERLKSGPLDVLVIGGGINGAGVVRDLALRSRHAGVPLRVALVEQHQFASGTSGRNSQLIHGGLRYLRNLQFGLVRESLRERELLLKLAPELVRPLAFLMPFYSRRSRLYYGAGLSIYDLLAGRTGLGRHRVLSKQDALATEPALAAGRLTSAALFHDGRVNAARFVLANVFDAIANGAIAANHLRAGRCERAGGRWRAWITDALSGETFEITARKIVDTTGPWSQAAPLRLVRGSHIILPRLTSGTHAIAWFDGAGRIVFVIPFGEAGNLSLAGTTDIDHESGPDDVRISSAEVEYLMAAVNRILPASRGMEPIAAYSALRPLIRDEAVSATRTSREHRIWNSPNGILHVAGGKYTTYRLMSEQAADTVAREIAPKLAGLHVTSVTPLPAPQPPQDPAGRIAFAVEQEMARHLADLMFISTYWGYEQQWTRARLDPYARQMGTRLGWNDTRIEEEVDSVPWRTAVPGRP